MVKNNRAYWYFNGQWKHVHIIERLTQANIFGQNIEICRVKLKEKTREVHEVEASSLLNHKPRRANKPKV